MFPVQSPQYWREVLDTVDSMFLAPTSRDNNLISSDRGCQ